MKLKTFLNPKSKKETKTSSNPIQKKGSKVKNGLKKLKKSLMKSGSDKAEMKRKNSVYSLLEEQDVIQETVANSPAKKQKSKKRKANTSQEVMKLDKVKCVAHQDETVETSVKKKKKKLSLEETALIDSPVISVKKSKKKKTATKSSDIEDAVIHTTEQRPSEMKDSRDSRVVFIGNLPANFKKKKVLKLLRECGNLERTWTRGAKPLAAKLPKKVAINKSLLPEDHPPLIMFALFKTAADARKALSLNGTMYEDHRLRVNLDKDKAQHDTNKGVFVGNLPFNIKDDELYKMFQQCGQIVGVRIVRDPKNGIGKGFGYVNFESTDSVELALNLNEDKLNGREIRVSRLFTAGKKKKLDRKKEKQLVESNLSKKPASFLATKKKFKKPSKSVIDEKTRKKKSKLSASELKKKVLAEKLAIKPKKNIRESLI